MKDLRWLWLGRVGYDEAHDLQLQVRDAVTRGQAPTTLILLEHDPIITLGRREENGDLLVQRKDLAARGIQVRRSERGGQATYHGPGQLVGYLFARARDLAADMPTLVGGIEDTMLGICSSLKVQARRNTEHRGVWVGAAKVGFVGLAVTHGVTWHGFALNVDPDLAPFELIRPCGLDDQVTSITESGGERLAPSTVAELAAGELARAFSHQATRAISQNMRDLRRSLL